MEKGQPVWLRTSASRWGWVPAVVHDREEVTVKGITVVKVTLRDDSLGNPARSNGASPFYDANLHRSTEIRGGDGYYTDMDPFEVTLTIDIESLERDELEDIKIRDYESAHQVVGGVHDLIGLAHLHEPAILHALRLRYDADIIYTSTGPILIAINPFKAMPLYSDEMMDKYRLQGEGGILSVKSPDSPNKDSPNKVSPSKDSPNKDSPKKSKKLKTVWHESGKRLPPHVYQTADDAYRAMMRGVESSALGGTAGRKKAAHRRGDKKTFEDDDVAPTNQSILVSGESGAGKTVTTKIVLKYFAMLSKLVTNHESAKPGEAATSVEQQVLDSNPILESFGNARTIRNDNSSRFGKYIDIRFSHRGRLTGATIDTYLLEKVRLIHQSIGERNFHVFYQLLQAATDQERDSYFLGDMQFEDFTMVAQSGTFDRRDMVQDADMHKEMLDAMVTMGFDAPTIKNIMRLIVAVLYAGNMTFTEKTSHKGETCVLDETEASLAVASLLGVSFEKLSAALTSRVLFVREGNIVKELNAKQAGKASEALIKSIYGANFDYIVKLINHSIHNQKTERRNDKSAYIGVLDIFGFETFETNNFEQLCINYTNETLQQHFNKHVFKLEQQEYEREGILWKFISFPDNQDVLDLIDMKRTGILAVLDEQCIVEWGSDDNFTRSLYTRCDKHSRFEASPAQRALSKFHVDHYAGPVEYSTDEWIEKNKDQLPAASVELLESSTFSFLEKLREFVRTESAGRRGSVVTKSVGAKFSEQLKDLRARIDVTAPHYVRCLKPNDDLLPDEFDPKNIVEQLRYSGVLEAVRVSRAGYPTRYPHDVFLSRYYMLGDLSEEGNRRQDIGTLIRSIAFDIWEHDNFRREAKEALESSKSKTKKAKKLKKRMNAQSNIPIPETKEDFDRLDFGTKCAVAGLQLGRTKVFLRREAFDRIEALRAVIYGKSACVIQSQMRARVQRLRYLRLRSATIKAQSAIRTFLTNLEIIRARRKAARERWAATAIQRAYRRYQFRKQSTEKRDAMVLAATKIQAFTRGSLVRSHLDDIQVKGDVSVASVAEREKTQSDSSLLVPTGPSLFEINLIVSKKAEMFRLLAEEKWDAAISLMEDHPLLAKQAEDETGRLPLHVVAEHNLHAVFEKVYKLFPDGAGNFDTRGRLPIHVAAECDALVPLKDLLSRHPEGADTMILRPSGRSGGGIPLHIGCKMNASGAVITALLSSNFNSAKKSDANGDLPIHLLLRNGSHVSGAVVQALLDTYPTAATRSDMYGDLPLSVALKHECKPEVVKVLLMHNPDAAKVLNGRDGHSPLFLAFQHNANDKTILGLMNHAPDLIVTVDKRTGMLPIEMATKQRHSQTIVHDLLKRDMPIDMKEKARAKSIPHQYSWNHLVSNAGDMYHDVISKVLQQCTQPQVLALSQVEDKHGHIAIVMATPLCKHEFRVMFRLFHTLQVVEQTPAYVNEENGTQIFHALRFPPPPQQSGFFTALYQEGESKLDYVENWDDSPIEPVEEHLVQDVTKLDIKQKLELIEKEKGTKVIAKLTSRSDIVAAEMSKRKEYHLSRNYVPAIICVHHTIQHAAYSEAMAEPSYCITMEGAEVTAENLLLDLRRSGNTFPVEALKSIAMSLLHLHEHGLIHGDFGSHNVGKFGNRWKILGISGSVTIGHPTDPKRGFFHPPEAVSLETRNVSLGEKNVGASVVSIESKLTYDIWAYGTLFYEALAGLPLSPYRSARKSKRAMTTAELFKVGQWDERSLRKGLRHIDGNDLARDLIKKLLHPNPELRSQSMREILEHPFFGIGKLAESSSIVKSIPATADPAPLVVERYSKEFMKKNGPVVEQRDTSTTEKQVFNTSSTLGNTMPVLEEENDAYGKGPRSLPAPDTRPLTDPLAVKTTVAPQKVNLAKESIIEPQAKNTRPPAAKEIDPNGMRPVTTPKAVPNASPLPNSMLMAAQAPKQVTVQTPKQVTVQTPKQAAVQTPKQVTVQASKQVAVQTPKQATAQQQKPILRETPKTTPLIQHARTPPVTVSGTESNATAKQIQAPRSAPPKATVQNTSKASSPIAASKAPRETPPATKKVPKSFSVRGLKSKFGKK